MHALVAAAGVEPWNVGEKEAEARPTEFVFSNEDDEFEQPGQLRKLTVGRGAHRGNEENMREKTIQCTESGAKCMLQLVALERNTIIDEGNVMLTKNREDGLLFHEHK